MPGLLRWGRAHLRLDGLSASVHTFTFYVSRFRLLRFAHRTPSTEPRTPNAEQGSSPGRAERPGGRSNPMSLRIRSLIFAAGLVVLLAVPCRGENPAVALRVANATCAE